MLQCSECELAQIGPEGQVHLRCNPFSTIKEPACLEKWQLLKLESLLRAYAATLEQYRRLAPLQEKMMKFMEREMDDVDEADKWKTGYEDEDEEEDEDQPGFGPLTP